MRGIAFKTLAGTLCATLVLVGGLVLTGCSETNPEDAIRQDITANFDQIKNLDDAAIEELADEMGETGLEDYGIDTTELITSMLDGFDYSIESITVDGDNAEATLSVTSKSMGELMNMDADAMTEALMEDLMSGALDANDDDAVNVWAGEYVMNLVDAIEPSEKTITLAYVNGDDGWELDESSGDALETIFTGDLSATTVSSEESEAPAEEEQQEVTPVEETETTSPSPTSTPTVSQQNALESARRYLDYTYFSHDGLIDQLEYEEFSTEDATWAADNCGADWNAQALGKAQDYLDYTPFSYTGLIGQLEYEGFTTEQATYAADSCGADWNEQAAKKAQDYLDYSSFSRDGLIGQLEYEGFTHDQAVYGVDSVGL